MTCEYCGPAGHDIRNCPEVPHFKTWDDAMLYVERLKKVGIWTGIRAHSLTPVRHAPGTLAELDSHGYMGKG